MKINQSAFYEIFCKQDQLLLIPLVANRISLIWIRFNKHWGKETTLGQTVITNETETTVLKKQDKDALIYASSL